MARPVHLRALRRAEHRLLREKLKDLSLSERVHQRYRIVSEVLKGHAVAEAADRVGCHFTVAYDWISQRVSGYPFAESVAPPTWTRPATSINVVTGSESVMANGGAVHACRTGMTCMHSLRTGDRSGGRTRALGA